MSLAGGDYATGALQLVFSAFWLLMAIWDRQPTSTGVPRWIHTAYVVFGLIFAGYGIAWITGGDTGMGVFFLVIGVSELLAAAFRGRPGPATSPESPSVRSSSCQ